MALAIHELCTNAVKYGALSKDQGRVRIDWSLDDGMLRLRWTEQGGPLVTTPKSRGFGSRMLERALAGELGGTVTLVFDPGGLCCSIEAPVPEAWLMPR
jgi:two-component sensor histidine kinase